MHILICTPEFGSGYGIGHAVWQETQELLQRGHYVSIISLSPPQAGDARRVSLQYIRIPQTPILDLLFFWVALRRVIKKVNLQKIDLIYVNGPTFGAFPFGQLNRPIVYFARSTVLGRHRALRGLQNSRSLKQRLVDVYLLLFEKRIIQKAETILVKSRMMAREVEELYRVRADRVTVIAGGITFLDFPEKTTDALFGLRQTLNIRLKDRVILFAGRIVPVKGFDLAVQAFSEVKSLAPDVVLVVAGSFPMSWYKQRIRKQIAGLKLSENVDIFFVGQVSYGNMSQYFQLATMTLVPSRYEPFGMVALQSIYSGTPVVVSSVAGCTEILKTENGLYTFELTKLDALSGIILSTLGRTAHGPSANTWSEVGEQLEEVFLDVVENR